MKKIRLLTLVMTVFFALTLCIDDSFCAVSSTSQCEIPSPTEPSGVLHHHHVTFNDHFLSQSYIPFLTSDFLTNKQPIVKVFSFSDIYYTCIWQPPKTNI